MKFIYTLDTPGSAAEIMVDGELFNSDADTIKSVIGEVSPGSIIYTEGVTAKKQKCFDGSWMEV